MLEVAAVTLVAAISTTLVEDLVRPALKVMFRRRPKSNIQVAEVH